MLPSVLSIYSLTLISMDRAFAVAMPYYHGHYVNHRRAFVVVMILWTMSICVVGLLFIVESKVFTLIAIVVAYVIPVSIMVVSYSVVGLVANRHAKRLNRLDRTTIRLRQSTHEDQVIKFADVAKSENDLNGEIHENKGRSLSKIDIANSRQDPLVGPASSIYTKKAFMHLGIKYFWREVRGALKLSFILFCFVTLWTPFMALNIEYFRCLNSGKEPGITLDMVKYFKLLHYSNSALNPVLYLMLNKSWKTAFKLTMCCKDDKRRVALKSVIGW